MPEEINPEYFHALERLLHTTSLFLSKQTGIGTLRQTMREAEKLAPQCEYCQAQPAFSVHWKFPDSEYTTYLCPDCDDKEQQALEE